MAFDFLDLRARFWPPFLTLPMPTRAFFVDADDRQSDPSNLRALVLMVRTADFVGPYPCLAFEAGLDVLAIRF